MQRTLFLALTMVSFLMACAPAAKPVSHPMHTIEKELPTADQALQTLSAAEVYGAWAIGYGGLPSAEAAALKALVADPDGARLLQLVIDNGTTTIEANLLEAVDLPAGGTGSTARFETETIPSDWAPGSYSLTFLATSSHSASGM